MTGALKTVLGQSYQAPEMGADAGYCMEAIVASKYEEVLILELLHRTHRKVHRFTNLHSFGFFEVDIRFCKS